MSTEQNNGFYAMVTLTSSNLHPVFLNFPPLDLKHFLKRVIIAPKKLFYKKIVCVQRTILPLESKTLHGYPCICDKFCVWLTGPN